MSMEEGALVEPVAVAVQICRTAGLRGGQTVLVLGCGPIGVLCQAVAKAHGAAYVVGVDISVARARFAREFAADTIYVNQPMGGGAPADPVEAARRVAETMVADFFALGGGADVVLECTGVESCIQTGVFAARKGGTFVQAGMGKEVRWPINSLGRMFFHGEERGEGGQEGEEEGAVRVREREHKLTFDRTSFSPSRRRASVP